jgi:NAD(P)-dependent dehydrogenase (short-subunit alcohol dehydrogenase family)
MNNVSDFRNGRSAFITGAASGIGLYTARVFLQHSWAVAIADNDREQGERASRELAQFGNVFFVPCDVSQPEDVRRAVTAGIAAFGRINVLVNNAGLLGPGDLLDSSDAELAKVLAVDLFGPLCVSKYMIEHMVKAGEGLIINVASIASFIGAPAYPAYGASKAGLIGLTKSLARRYARNNVRINCVCPGSVRDTKLTFRSRKRDYTTREKLALAAKIPIGRSLRPQEVAELIFFLASPAASAMTGTTIVLDGGEMLGQ